MKKIIYNVSLLLATGGCVLTSCSRDFTETQFFEVEKAAPISTVEQMRSFVNGMYVKMRSGSYLGRVYKAVGQIHTDETYCTQLSGRNVPFATYNMTSQDADARDVWYAIYQVIGNANIVIGASGNNLTLGGSTLTNSGAAEVKYLVGQAYAVRALAFFDLLRLYGQEYSSGNLGVVLPKEYDPNAKQARASVDETRAQIESDFQMALSYMGDSGNKADRTYLNGNSVKALMSRYFLYKGDYASAAKYAEEVISSGVYSVAKAGDLQLSFSKENADNSVFELAAGLNGALGFNAYDYLMNSEGYANIAVLPEVFSSYDKDDVRRNLILETEGVYFLDGKYSNMKGSSNVKVVRYEEVLLNAAEAQIMLGNSSKALQYYNMIVKERNLSPLSAITLADVKKERTKELLGEGLRYWDLLRWGSVIPYYSKAGIRETKGDKLVGDYQLAFPIPRTETLVTGSLVKANPSYDN